MSTIINNPGGEGSGSGGVIIAVVLVVIVAILFFVFALPALQNKGDENPSAGIELNLGGGDQ